MSRTGEQLLDGFSRFLGDQFESTTTSAGSTTTLVDTALTKFGDRRLEGWYIRITENVNGNQYLVRRITAFAAATGTVTVSPAFPGATGSGTDYELHRYEPAEKFKALDDARADVFNDVFQIVRDETITCDGRTTEFAVPTSLGRSPVAVYCEEPINATDQWNLLTSPLMDSLTGWTASAGTAEIVQQDPNDPLVPKYDMACTRLAVPSSTAVTYSQVVANLNIDDASVAAGRRMVYAKWVYCRTASRVTLSVVDDSGTLGTSTAHGGKGWELLSVTVDVSAGNSTLLTPRLNVSSGTALVIWMNRAWFFFGDQLPVRWTREPVSGIEMDASYQKFWLPEAPKKGRQLRVVGKAILSALGDTVSSQPTATMEVDQQTEKLLFAEAAAVMFRRLGLKVSDAAVLQRNMAIVEEQRANLRMKWSLPPVQRRIESPFI